MSLVLPAGSRVLAEDIKAITDAITDLIPIEYVLSSAETRTSTTTFTDSAILVALAANVTYDADFWCALLGAQAGDFKGQWTFPANATVTLWQLAPATSLSGVSDEGSVNYGAKLADSSSPLGTNFAGVLDGSNPVSMHQRLRVVMGSTAGNLRLQWAQNTSNATATTLCAGAKLSARRASSTG
jgi:hypothetical protein